MEIFERLKHPTSAVAVSGLHLDMSQDQLQHPLALGRSDAVGVLLVP